jgi:hypothetical protein
MRAIVPVRESALAETVVIPKSELAPEKVSVTDPLFVRWQQVEERCCQCRHEADARP